MYYGLDSVTLRNGEPAQLGVVLGPDSSDRARHLRELLAHKGPIWQWQIEQSLTKEQAGAESRFYILSKAGRPFANVMVVERRGIGIFGHVYTRPEERRNGAADIIIGCLADDFRQRGGRALYLGTGFDSPAYRLYAKHGFRSVEPESGHMAWFAGGRETFERDAFAPAAVRHEPLAFHHWPLLPALAMMAHPARVRIATMDAVNSASTEGGALPVLMAMNGEAEHGKEHGARAHVAVSEGSGVPVAIACAMPEHYFWEQVDVVDLFCAPEFEAELRPLLATLELGLERAAICYADLFWPAKQDVLRACGFERAVLLKRHLRSHGKVHDVELWTRG
ncbi:MAG: GNAT family N-acetyltransferase [Planctomycetota bacterium]|nr:GNAT family N-acetyltransferase [Planctomycetota bacterium]